MEDLELKELARNIGIWLFVLIVFGSLFVIILINKFGVKDISINQAIDKEDELVVLVLNTDTKNRNEIKKCLNENNVSYKIVYKNRERYFDDFLLFYHSHIRKPQLHLQNMQLNYYQLQAEYYCIFRILRLIYNSQHD